MKHIVSNKMYSPQNFLEVLTKHIYLIRGDNDIDLIHLILKENGIESEDEPLWDYPLNEVTDDNGLDSYVVLVGECMVTNDNDEYEPVIRWFEIPESYKDKFND